jgi:hypothetical protein
VIDKSCEPTELQFPEWRTRCGRISPPCQSWLKLVGLPRNSYAVWPLSCNFPDGEQGARISSPPCLSVLVEACLSDFRGTLMPSGRCLSNQSTPAQASLSQVVSIRSRSNLSSKYCCKYCLHAYCTVPGGSMWVRWKEIPISSIPVREKNPVYSEYY